MGKRILSFEVDADGTFTGTPTPDIFFNYSTGIVNIGTVSAQISDLSSIAQAITELISQSSNDGTVFLTNQSSNGVIITWNPVAQTIAVGGSSPWPKAVAESFVDAIVNGV